MRAARNANDSRETRPGGGLFCVVEGIDGSGKSTLLTLLYAVLEDAGMNRHFGERFRALRKLREPTGGAVGRRIRAHLQAGDRLADEEWLRLFFEDRAENVAGNIRPALNAGDLVLQDRYFYSTAAYQAKSPEDSAHIVQRSLDAGFPEPDVVLYLAIEPESAIARIHNRLKAGAAEAPASGESAPEEKRSIESFETLEQLSRIHRNYSRILPPHALRLDAEQSPEQLCEIALAHLEAAARASASELL